MENGVYNICVKNGGLCVSFLRLLDSKLHKLSDLKRQKPVVSQVQRYEVQSQVVRTHSALSGSTRRSFLTSLAPLGTRVLHFLSHHLPLVSFYYSTGPPSIFMNQMDPTKTWALPHERDFIHERDLTQENSLVVGFEDGEEPHSKGNRWESYPSCHQQRNKDLNFTTIKNQTQLQPHELERGHQTRWERSLANTLILALKDSQQRIQPYCAQTHK